MTTPTDNPKETDMTDTERSKHYRFRIELEDGTGVLLYVSHIKPVAPPAHIAQATSPIKRINTVPVDDLEGDLYIEQNGGFKAWLAGVGFDDGYVNLADT